MDHLPIFCRLHSRYCLLIGGGVVAERKARLLLDAGARLTVNARSFSPQFTAWSNTEALTLVQGSFDSSLLNNCWLVIAATDDDALNTQISTLAEQRQIFCNVVDAPREASFIMPSIVDRSPLMVAISSGGTSPVLARLLREKLEALLPQYLGQVARYAGQLRQRVKNTFATLSERRRFWEKFFVNDRLAQSLANHDQRAVNRVTEELFEQPLGHRGEVVLVGAGPGDAGLLTLKGLQQLQQADVVVYDRLVSNEIMTLIRRDADRIFVGKKAGCHCVSQEEINQILLHAAQSGKRVVRLKGGDPFIFGRGGEELETLRAANIPFSVVPGITAASGCSAYAGIPLTHRDYAQSVCLVTGHAQQDSELDWHNLASQKQTLVFYMGLNRATIIQQKLIEHGMPSDMPVAIVENGTAVHQRTSIGVLSELAQLADQRVSPGLILVGEVVQLRARLNWFSDL